MALLPTAVSSLTHSDGNTPANNDKLLAQLARSFAEHIPDEIIEEGGPKLEAAIRFEIQLQEVLGRTRPFGRRPNPRQFTVRGGHYRLRQEHSSAARQKNAPALDRRFRKEDRYDKVRYRNLRYALWSIAESLESDVTSPQWYDEMDGWCLDELESIVDSDTYGPYDDADEWDDEAFTDSPFPKSDWTWDDAVVF